VMRDPTEKPSYVSLISHHVSYLSAGPDPGTWQSAQFAYSDGLFRKWRTVSALHRPQPPHSSSLFFRLALFPFPSLHIRTED